MFSKRKSGFHILLMYNFIGFVFNNLCPKECVPCLENLISCSNGGLDRIPTDLYMETKKITLIGHTFSQTFLSRQNFSKFAKPKYSIEQLSIRRSNIDTIQYQAFYDVSGLDFLDLSENHKLTIEDRALDNLKLKHLKLDSIGTLEFGSHALHGLLVASLSMKNSRLQQLPFSLIEPLIHELRKLFLSNNSLTYLSSQFEVLFRQLTVLDLHENPLICSCQLLWLGVTLRWRQSHYHSQSDSFSEVQQPICVSPMYLRGQFLHKIPDYEFNCQPPKLERIEVQFKSHQSAIIRCTASMRAKRAPISILWQYLNPPDSTQQPKLLATANANEAQIEITRKNPMDKYFCSVITSAGNASVQLNFNWPNLSSVRKWSANSTNGYHFVSKSPWKPTDFHENYFFREQYTLLELVGSIFGTFIATILVFIIIYKFYFFKAIKMKKEQLKKSGYVTYEAGLYSDSQTYDIPQYTSSDFRKKLYQPVFQIPQNRLYTDCKEQNNV